MPISIEERSGRVEKARKLMAEQGVDALLMSGGTSMIYFSNVRWWLSERLTIRGDAAFQLWQIDTPPGFALPARGFIAVEESEWVSGFRMSVAAVLRW